MARHRLQRLQRLPVELLLEILSFAAARSAGNYRTLLLVSKKIEGLVKLHCLQVVPVVLDDCQRLRSFHHLLQTCPQVANHVRYLWIVGEGHTCWHLIDAILASCTRIVSLACTSRSLTALCSSSPSSPTPPTACTDLTLIESWHAWDDIIQTPHGPKLCAQLTRLRLQEGLTPQFPRHLFPRLTHLAFASRPIRDYLARHLETLKPLRRLRHIVVTTLWWRDGLGHGGLSQFPGGELLEMDERLEVLDCKNGWTELGAWRDGVGGGWSLWDRARLERRSMVVFQGAFKALVR
ncbi:hypothetical protein D9615_008872 [Tricholomella constricta]|uniref:F-box domain-containing protein n=1 Tax=Tricholomella constricta TaxID=117010 RepID=A0A8H5H010_9AGAR|nr:hypothetical protein D9615_008872 [Tricholomella constricta]